MLSKQTTDSTGGILPAKSVPDPYPTRSRFLIQFGSVKPIHYHLALSNLEYGGSWRYHGLVIISATVLVPTNKIVLNGQNLHILSACVKECNSSQGDWTPI